jgi:hypothetical protein
MKSGNDTVVGNIRKGKNKDEEVKEGTIVNWSHM